MIIIKDAHSRLEVGKNIHELHGGSRKTLGKYDSIWGIIGTLTKSAHFIMIKVDYNSLKFTKTCQKYSKVAWVHFCIHSVYFCVLG